MVELFFEVTPKMGQGDEQTRKEQATTIEQDVVKHVSYRR